jgi:hypothetical protein
MLTADELESAFTELGVRVRREGKVIDLAVYGGSALMLASNFRVATQDVDAVTERDQSIVARLAADIARERNWPADWLNEGVRAYLSRLAACTSITSFSAPIPRSRNPACASSCRPPNTFWR